MYCENCGKRNEEGARFCEACGTPLVNYEQENGGTVHLYGEPLRDERVHHGSYHPYENARIYKEPALQPKKKKSNAGIYAAVTVTVVLVIALVIGIVMLVKSNQEINGDDVGVSEVTPTPEVTEEPTPSPTPLTDPNPTPLADPTATPTPTALPTPIPTATPAPTQVPAVEYVSVKYGLVAPTTDFQFPYSSERLLTQAELASMESDSIDVMHSKSQLAINEILARYGYSFDPNNSDTSRDIYERVAGKDWYVQAQAQCGYTSANALIADMNSIEKQNIDLINTWQQAHGCYY